MKKIILLILVLSITLHTKSYLESQNKSLSLVEEDKLFWDNFLNIKAIKNKNLLYASYIAYKDRLNDLSIETFQECLKINSSNSIATGVINYYIGKNLFLIGKYKDAITQFTIVKNNDMAKFNYIKFAALLNTAIAYYQLGDNEKFRENLQKVISEDISGNYKKKALDMLSQVQ